ncbi:MAG: hypothetical protein FWG42_05400 [Clostridiales bacterium]|nr:hypothetical protein [Clostridiales bacterium]
MNSKKFKITKLQAAVAAVIFTPGINLFGTLSSPSVGNGRMIRVSNPLNAFNAIKADGNKNKIQLNSGLANSSSHIQSYARYRGSSYDFHVFSHSNLAGEVGYIYFVSEERNYKNEPRYSLTLKIPQKTEKDKAGYWYNHPGGIQIIGDFMIVPVISAYGKVAGTSTFTNRSIIYIVDLTPLKSSTPSVPNNIKEIMREPNGSYGSLSAAGIVDIKKELTGDVKTDKAGSNDIRYMMALYADERLEIYISDVTSNLWDAKNYDYIKKYSFSERGKNNYQTIGLFCDTAGDVYMLGFRTNGTNDYCDLYKLTVNNGTELYKVTSLADNDTYEMLLKSKHLTCKQDGVNDPFLGVHVTNGAGFEIISADEFWLYATSGHAGGNVMTNYFTSPLRP